MTLIGLGYFCDHYLAKAIDASAYEGAVCPANATFPFPSSNSSSLDLSSNTTDSDSDSVAINGTSLDSINATSPPLPPLPPTAPPSPPATPAGRRLQIYDPETDEQLWEHRFLGDHRVIWGAGIYALFAAFITLIDATVRLFAGQDSAEGSPPSKPRRIGRAKTGLTTEHFGSGEGEQQDGSDSLFGGGGIDLRNLPSVRGGPPKTAGTTDGISLVANDGAAAGGGSAAFDEDDESTRDEGNIVDGLTRAISDVPNVGQQPGTNPFASDDTWPPPEPPAVSSDYPPPPPPPPPLRAWSTALDGDGNVYYWNEDGVSTYDKPADYSAAYDQRFE